MRKYLKDEQENKFMQQRIKQQVEKTEYFKLVSELQQQKKMISQHQLESLKQQIIQVRAQNEKVKKQLLKMNRKYEKLKQKEKIKDQFNLKTNKYQQQKQINLTNEQQTYQCYRCSQFQLLQSQLHQQRNLYSNDRLLFKNQIHKLKQQTFKIKALQQQISQINNCLNQQIVLNQNLKQQLTLSYKKAQHQCAAIQMMSNKLSLFQLQYSQLLNQVKKLQNISQNTFKMNLVNKKYNIQAHRDNTHQNYQKHQNLNDKYRKLEQEWKKKKLMQNKRKCGSIKKIQTKLNETYKFVNKGDY